MNTSTIIFKTLLPKFSVFPLINLSISRYSSSLPFNTMMMFVPQQEAWIIERMGKFNRILQPGLNFLLPFIERVRYVQNLKEIPIEIPQQGAITADNVGLTLDGVLYLKIFDPYKASYGVEDPEFAISQLAQTNMRSEIGKISLDSVFKERESLNIMIVGDVKLPNRVQEAMQMQVEAERKKRAAILESEGMRESAINIAEGEKSARIMSSEAEKAEKINVANGEAEGLIAKAIARSKSLDIISKALSLKDGKSAASFAIAEQYVKTFGNLAKQNNTLILPAQTGDVSSMVAQALSIFKSISNASKSDAIKNEEEMLESPQSGESRNDIKDKFISNSHRKW
ncbi:stomatin-like protein stl-1 isoform X2 [Gordionus sp. m RMFG-2023]|uniref:stomatin-like protein stl-1 isoform X2 n=1 Tax=Gordionus sp. m RMFG-2023 TaxID=3053472 RepID=UPI0031FBFB3B